MISSNTEPWLIPNLFYGIKVGTIRRPVQDIDIICRQKLPGYCDWMWTDIIVQKGDVWTMELNEWESFHCKNIIYVSISITVPLMTIKRVLLPPIIPPRLRLNHLWNSPTQWRRRIGKHFPDGDKLSRVRRHG